MHPPSVEALRPLCLSLGIQTEYHDIWGARHIVPDSTLLAILAAFGYDTSSPQALAASVEARELEIARTPLDPVKVLSVSDPSPVVSLRLPTLDGYAISVSLAIYLEDNTALRRDIELKAEKAGSLPLPTGLPLGYHDLEIAVTHAGRDHVRASMRLIVAPDRAFLPAPLETGGRSAGLAVSLYGVRSDRNWGAGDFTDLRRLVQWTAQKLNAGFVALNPLHALHNRQPYNISPYLPLSGFYRNYLYLDIERVPDFESCALARRIAASPSFQARLRRLREAEFVEYEEIARLKRRMLLLLFRSFYRQEWLRDSYRAKAFRQYLAEEGELLESFATYCALDEVLHARDRQLWIWPDWPSCYRDSKSSAVKSFSRQHRRRVLFHMYVQWQIDKQLASVQAAALEAGMPIGLYHDVALATDRCGADLWAYRDYFIRGCRVGAPPDDFSPEGQDWAFPPPNTLHHRAREYRLFAESIRKNARHGGALRIDHVMRFFRLFWIPEGLTAKQGTYVHEPWQDLLRILALESVRGRFLVVGEDLGTVPPELREAMERFGM